MHNYELVHSSRVKFIYPSEEEMGDLTFIVAERKTPASSAPSSSRSFNVLLYLLVFQVGGSAAVRLLCFRRERRAASDHVSLSLSRYVPARSTSPAVLQAGWLPTSAAPP